jgi:hypothetical protein
MKSTLCIPAAAAIVLVAQTVHAASVTVDFEGLDGGRNAILEQPRNFYNGGLGSFGSGPGPDYGLTFLPLGPTSSEPQVICNLLPTCNTGGNSLRIFGDEQNGMEYGTILHIEGGFRGVLEFDLKMEAGGGVYVKTKTVLNDASNITIARLENPDPSDPCGGLDCAPQHYVFDLAADPYTPDDVVAHYILFETGGTDRIYIDNIRFHDLILPDAPPTTVAEPGTLGLSAMALAGLGLFGRRRKSA